MFIKTILTTRRATLHAVVPDAEKDAAKISHLVGIIVESHEVEQFRMWHYVTGLGFLPVQGITTLAGAQVYFDQDTYGGHAA